MKTKLNLCEILKGHEGKTFYSPAYGDVKLIKAISGGPIIVKTDNHQISFNPNGILLFTKGECMLFPSKDQRDWNKWVEKQKSKVPKIWNEMTSKYCDVEVWQHISHMDYGSTEPIVKSALAILKIHQLIEAGYGGLVTHSENLGTGIKYTITPYVDNEFQYKGLKVLGTCYLDNRHISFHTKEQAEEFFKYPENIQLLKDYFML